MLFFIILGLLFLFLIVFGAIFLDSVFGGLDFGTSAHVTDKVVQIIKQRHLENGNLYDLGSARGGFALKISRIFPKMKITGIDDSAIRTFFAKTRSLFAKNLKFKKENLFNSDVSSANIAYLYLPQELMPQLETKLRKELQLGALVISASVSFPSWQPMEVYDLEKSELKVPKLFIYAKS